MENHKELAHIFCIENDCQRHFAIVNLYFKEQTGEKLKSCLDKIKTKSESEKKELLLNIKKFMEKEKTEIAIVKTSYSNSKKTKKTEYYIGKICIYEKDEAGEYKGLISSSDDISLEEFEKRFPDFAQKARKEFERQISAIKNVEEALKNEDLSYNSLVELGNEITTRFSPVVNSY